MALRTTMIRALSRWTKCTVTSISTPVEFYGRNNEYRNKKTNINDTISALLFGAIVVGSAFDDQKESRRKPEHKERAQFVGEAGEKRPDLPTYRASEVSQHNTKDSFWVIYRHGVYDVTKFLPAHPGGEQILNAGGLSIEPFWNVYGMHKTLAVYATLESYRIGNLHDDDIVDYSDEEMWAKEPYRDRRLIVRTARPFNAEIPPKFQSQYFDTPNELFYVRQHMPVPELNGDRHKLKVTIRDKGKAKEFSLRDLERFPRVNVRAALMCAGNRRSEMNKAVDKSVKGIGWSVGAVSNAVWGGVLLRDVLMHCGLDLDASTSGKHVVFTGSDIDATGQNFSTSIPLDMALNPNARILIATHMNGKPLPPDHGFPLRVVVPGAPAVRSVKWLESITVSNQESQSHWHLKDYRSFNPSETWETADFSTAPPVYSLPVTSAICDPEDGDTVTVKNGHIEVKGYAYSGGGAQIVRVDVSNDEGKTWQKAKIVKTDDAPPSRHYGWTLWSVKMPASGKQMDLWVKATDSNFNTQPERFDDIWNIRGILGNAYHRIKVELKY